MALALAPPTPRGSVGRDVPALTLLASLTFMWGFITVINNTLPPHWVSGFALAA